VGAALGTGLAELITALLMLYFLLFHSKILGILRKPEAKEQHPADDALRPTRMEWGRGVSGFRPQADVVRMAFKIGAPMGLQHMLMGGAQIVSTLIVAPLGTIAIASHSLAITVESLCYMPGFGIAEAATTLVGQGIGAGQKVLTKSLALMSVGMGIVVMTFMGILMWTFAPELMTIMSPVEDVIALGTDVLRIEAWAEPMFAAAIVCNGIFVGAGDTLKPAFMSLASMWGVRLTLAWYLSKDYGLMGVWLAMAIELTFRGIIFLTRLFTGNWNNKLKLKIES
jgi:Na+-driven multidrug efflux pump